MLPTVLRFECKSSLQVVSSGLAVLAPSRTTGYRVGQYVGCAQGHIGSRSSQNTSGAFSCIWLKADPNVVGKMLDRCRVMPGQREPFKRDTVYLAAGATE